MPTLPDYGQPRVAPDAAPGVRVADTARPATFGVPSSVDLSGVHEVFAKELQQADQAAVSDADAQVVRAKTARLWDPTTGAMQARGRDAIAAQDAAQQGFQQDVAQIAKSLHGDAQQRAFRERVNMHYADLGAQLGQHVATQITQANTDTLNGHVNALAEAAQASYQDDKSVQQAIDDTRATMTDYFRANGHAGPNGTLDDFAKYHIDQRVSAIRAAVFSQLSDTGQDLAADAYLKAHKADFVGHDLLTAEKVNEVGSSRAAGRAAAQKILAEAPTLSAAMAKLEAIDEPRTQDYATRMVERHFAMLAQSEREEQSSAFHKSVATLVTNGYDLSALPIADQQKMSSEQLISLHHMVDEHLHPKEYGDATAYLHALNLANVSPQSHAAFRQEDFLNDPKYAGLSSTQRAHLITLQRTEGEHDARAGDTAARRAEALVERDANDQARMTRELAAAKKLPDKAAQIAETQRITAHYAALQAARHPQQAGGTVTRLGTSTPDPVTGTPAGTPYNPVAGILHAAPVIQPTPAMLEGAARNPAYAKYLRSMNVALPATLPAVHPKGTP